MSNNSPSQGHDPNNSNNLARRTTSLSSLIRRPKSNDLINDRKASNSRLRKKSLDRERDSDSRAGVKETAPSLPTVAPQPVIQSFGGENYKPRMTSSEIANGIRGAPPVPPVPAGLQSGPADPYARTESMTHRSRYSYAHSTTSTLNSPRRVRRRKDPTPYNILIIGARNSGKTSFLNFLKSSLALGEKKSSSRTPDAVDSPPPSANVSHNFVHHYQEIEIDKERIGLTLWDSEGLEKGVIDLQLRDITNFVESKFDDTFVEEMKVVRAPGVRDTEIHCVFLILDPSRLGANLQAAQKASNRPNKTTQIIGALEEDFDLQVLRSLQGKTTVIPIISKADTVTTAHMKHLKRMVWEALKRAGLDPLEALNVEQEEESDSDRIEEDEEDEFEDAQEGSSSLRPERGDLKPESGAKRHNRRTSNMSMSSSMMDSGYVPMSILSPDQYSLDTKGGPVGREFPWGFADPYNPEHCDFVKLKDAVFNEWRNEVREVSRVVFYEHWRTNRLNRQSVNGPKGAQGKRPSGAIPFHMKDRSRY